MYDPYITLVPRFLRCDVASLTDETMTENIFLKTAVHRKIIDFLEYYTKT